MAVGWWMDIYGSKEAMFLSTIKNILFPVFCLNCDKEGEWLCVDCGLKVKSNYQYYPDVDSLDGLTVFFNYNEKSIIGKLIKLLKYNYIRELEYIIYSVIPARPSLAEGIYDYFKDFSIIPIPLHPRRLRERGFNQSEMIAKIFVNKFNFKKVENNILQRTKYTAQQAKLNKADRQQNLQDVFAIKKSVYVPENILLVDDVYTTGSTMYACANVLRKAGAEKVFGMVLARGV